MNQPGRIVVMGVSACGKSTVGHLLAQRLGLPFLEGDALHPDSNIDAMRRGIPLDDAMRRPWLQAIAGRLADPGAPGIVAACSALKRSYRDLLSPDGTVFFVHLDLPAEEARTRMSARPGHFMSPSLADSQLATLEPLTADEPGIVLDATLPPEQIVGLAARAFAAWRPDMSPDMET